MKRFKIIATILIISGSFVVSYFIVKNSAPADGSGKNSGRRAGVNPAITNPLQWATDGSSDAGQNGLIGGESFTQGISEAVFEQVQSAALSGQELDADSVSEETMEDIFKNKQLELSLVSDINNSELKISGDNSQEAKIKYLETALEASRRNFGDFKKHYLEIVVDVYQKNDVSSASRLANIYKNLADDYLNIGAPSDWLDIHKSAVIFFKNSQIIFQGMAVYLNDSIKGYLALEMIDSWAKQAGQLQSVFEEKSREAGL